MEKLQFIEYIRRNGCKIPSGKLLILLDQVIEANFNGDVEAGEVEVIIDEVADDAVNDTEITMADFIEDSEFVSHIVDEFPAEKFVHVPTIPANPPHTDEEKESIEQLMAAEVEVSPLVVAVASKAEKKKQEKLAEQLAAKKSEVK